MYPQQYHQTKETQGVGLQSGLQKQTVFGEITQRLSSATVRIGDVNVRLKDVYSKAFGSSPEAIEKPADRPTPISAVTEIMGCFDLLERRIAELENRASELNKIV